MKNKDVKIDPRLHTAGILARIVDEKKGYKEISGVFAVRVRNQNSSLVIMTDYVPALGQIDGDVSFLTENDEVLYKDIKGFYKHKDNVFTLIVEQTSKGWY